MGKMVRIALVKRLTNAPAEKDDPTKIDQRHGQKKQRDQHGPTARMSGRVKMWKNGEHGKQVTDQVASGIAQKCPRSRKVEREEAQKGAEAQKGNECDQVLPSGGCDQTEIPGGN